jgi:hypothetical protein
MDVHRCLVHDEHYRLFYADAHLRYGNGFCSFSFSSVRLDLLSLYSRRFSPLSAFLPIQPSMACHSRFKAFSSYTFQFVHHYKDLGSDTDPIQRETPFCGRGGKRARYIRFGAETADCCCGQRWPKMNTSTFESIFIDLSAVGRRT